MKTILITLILLTNLFSDQNNSTFFGIKQTTQDSCKTFKQKDGSTFKGVISGKEFFTYIELDNGYIALFNKTTGQYEYAIVKNQKLQASGISVNTNPIPKEIKKIPEELLEQLQEQAFKKHL